MNASIRPDTAGAAFSGTGIVLRDRVFSANGMTEALKFSAAANVVIAGECSAIGGEENACDINNGSYITVAGRLTLAGGQQAGLVVKGGSFLITENGSVSFFPSPQSKTDILADDWSDQSPKSSFIQICATRSDGKPVRIVFGRWRRPYVFGGPSRVVWSWTIGLHAYNIAKGLVRWALRIPQGVKGPSWM